MNRLSEKGVSLLLELERGCSIATSRFPSGLLEELKAEEVVTEIRIGRGHKVKLSSKESLDCFLAQRYGISRSLEDLLEATRSATRGELVEKSGNSKSRSIRTFKGFLVNSYSPIIARLRGKPFVIAPAEGTSVFINDWEHFEIPEETVVVGFENGENFHSIRSQRYLFEGMTPLFVSRYPRSSDLVKWLKGISNRYIHFGDFDLAGIHIFLTEFYSELKDRAEMFVPDDIEWRIKENRWELYDKQYEKYHNIKVEDKRLQRLVDMINHYHKSYEQEGYIKSGDSSSS